MARLLILFLVFVSSNAWAACSGTAISNLPYTVNSSGDYCFTNNLSYDGSGAGLSINANNVTVDLDGFTYTFASSNVGTDWISMSGRNNVTIKNGTITHGGATQSTSTGFASGGNNSSFVIEGITFNLQSHSGCTSSPTIHFCSGGSSDCVIFNGSDTTSNVLRDNIFNLTGVGRLSLCREAGCGRFVFENNVVNVDVRSCSSAQRTDLFYKPNQVTIRNNTFIIPSTAKYIYLFEMRDTQGTVIEDNIIDYRANHGRIFNFENSASNNIARNNLITVNGSGNGNIYVFRLRVVDGKQAAVQNNIIDHNTVQLAGSSTAFFIHMEPQGNSGSIVRNNTFSYNKVSALGTAIALAGNGAGQITGNRYFCNDISGGSSYAYNITEDGMHSPGDIFSHNRTTSNGSSIARINDTSSVSTEVCQDEEWTSARTTGSGASSVSFTGGSCQNGTPQCWESAGSTGRPSAPTNLLIEQ